MNDDNVLKPILKWAGGKRRLVPMISPLVPKNYSTYVEPFVGGAAVLLHLQPKKAIINDYNAELINVYHVVKNQPKELIEQLKHHKIKHQDIGKDHFDKIRAWDREEDYFLSKYSDVQKAARIMYLNKACYNGLYRVNSRNQFNTPYGKYANPNIVNEDDILKLSNYLNENDITIKNGDYQDILQSIEKDSFVYLDPPYLPVSETSSFTKYTNNGFSLQDQIDLRDQCDILNRKGIKFLLSNSNHPEIYKLYENYDIREVLAKRSINGIGSKRGYVKEVLIKNYD